MLQSSLSSPARSSEAEERHILHHVLSLSLMMMVPPSMMLVLQLRARRHGRCLADGPQHEAPLPCSRRFATSTSNNRNTRCCRRIAHTDYSNAPGSRCARPFQVELWFRTGGTVRSSRPSCCWGNAPTDRPCLYRSTGRGCSTRAWRTWAPLFRAALIGQL